MGRSSRAEACIVVRDEVLASIVEGKLHPATALLQRKMIIKGKLTAIAKFKPDLLIKPRL